MKKCCFRLLAAILIILVLCLPGCVTVQRPTPGGSEISSPQQSVQPEQEIPNASTTIRPIDELARPGYDVKTSILWDLNGDGTRETISIGQGDAREIGFDILLSVSDNRGFNTVTAGSGYFEKADFITAEGGAFCVIVSFSGENDYSSTVLVSFNSLTPALHGSVEGIAEGGAGAGWIATDSYVDVLGTWPCTNVYKVTEQFTFERQGDCYIKTGCDPLITKIELPVKIWKDGDYSPASIKAGTALYPASTDEKTYMKFGLRDYFEPGDYVEGMVDLTASDSGYLVGGVSEYDCFETVPYAG